MSIKCKLNGEMIPVSTCAPCSFVIVENGRISGCLYITEKELRVALENIEFDETRYKRTIEYKFENEVKPYLEISHDLDAESLRDKFGYLISMCVSKDLIRSVWLGSKKNGIRVYQVMK